MDGRCIAGSELMDCYYSNDSSSHEELEKVWRYCRMCCMVAHVLVHAALQSKKTGSHQQTNIRMAVGVGISLGMHHLCHYSIDSGFGTLGRTIEVRGPGLQDQE